MSGLGFSVLDVFAEPYTVVPQLTARLRIEEDSGERIHATGAPCGQVRRQPCRDAEREQRTG